MSLDLPLPKQVFGHPWLLQGGDKMSKSKGNVIYADDLIDLFGVDATRYFVLHEMPFENDGVITWELVTERTNSDLANTLGNLVNRTISMSNKYFDGVVKRTGATEEVDDDLKAVVTGTAARVAAKMDNLRVADAITEIFALFKRCNKYIDETTPWALAKDESKQDRLAEVLYNLTESILIGASLLKNFLPDTADRIAAQLNGTLRSFEEAATFGLYADGTKVTATPEILFARIDWKEIEPKIAEIRAAQKAEYDEEQERVAAVYAKHGLTPQGTPLAAATADSSKNETTAAGAFESASGADASASEAAGAEEGVVDVEPKEEIEYDDFAKLQFQVGVILACEEVPKSKKLLCSKVQVGSKVLQIVSGIKQHYSAAEMPGKRVMVLTNLKPAKLAGIVSEGMLLCAEDADGNLSLMTPEKAMPAGAEIL
jgi:methionyl-tRNA synthetase